VEKEIQAALIGAVAGLAGVIIGGGITWLITRSTNKMQKQIAEENVRTQERTMLDGLVVKMLEFLMEHPHLEKAEFCGSYPNITGHPNGKERYEAYCIFVFNFLMRAFKHFGEDPAKLGDYIGLEEIMKCHHKWWYHDKENYGYDEPFRQCIQSVFDKLRKEGKIA
jgi:hypothetical protein